ncbi:MAG: hypothetical protein JXR37_18470 [Kiritimatiellae bacterium]|nr:hypothetical protein [Kiritimatiellia bacterium]
MRTRALIVSALFIGCCAAASAADAPENLVDNGDFSKGKFKWKGDARAATLDASKESPAGNPCLSVVLDKKDSSFVSQKIRIPREATTLKVDLRLRFEEDPKAKGGFAPGMITLRLAETEKIDDKAENSNRIKGPKCNVVVDEKGVWQPVAWEVAVPEPKNIKLFVIECQYGRAILHIDDVVVKVAGPAEQGKQDKDKQDKAK